MNAFILGKLVPFSPHQILFSVTSRSIDDLSKIQVAGLWATDNSAELWFNGSYTGFNKFEWGFTRLDPFLISGGFVDGVNTIEFRVLNFSYPQYPSGNPTGLLVAGLTAVDDGSLTLPRPEPGSVPDGGTTFVLLAATCLLLRAVRRREMTE